MKDFTKNIISFFYILILSVIFLLSILQWRFWYLNDIIKLSEGYIVMTSIYFFILLYTMGKFLGTVKYVSDEPLSKEDAIEIQIMLQSYRR
jgi:hypothetical protein